MASFKERYAERLERLSRRIVAAQRPLRILRAVTWPDIVRERFFAAGARQLPQAEYPPLAFDPRRAVDEMADILAELRTHDPLERILMETCLSYIGCARMLARIGTKEFYLRSRELYGRPGDPFDAGMTQLELALHFDRSLRGFRADELSPQPRRTISAGQAVLRLRRRFRRAFGEGLAPRVRLARMLVADAAAGSATIRIKAGRSFSDLQLGQLEQHEGYVHAATTLNGRRQKVLSILGKGAPRTVACQEGLAVFAEMMTRHLDVARLRVLKDRVIAIKMAEDGADFLQLHRFFLEETGDEMKAFDHARRIVRGGRVEGGAPFTKDLSYLSGLVRVYTWVRSAMRAGRPDLLRFLWVGKVAIEDVPVLYARHLEGIVDGPAFLPDWVRDVHHLAAYMCFSAFVDRLDSTALERSYERILAQAPAGP